VVTTHVYAAHAGARIMETMYWAPRSGTLGEQVGTLTGAGPGAGGRGPARPL